MYFGSWEQTAERWKRRDVSLTSMLSAQWVCEFPWLSAEVSRPNACEALRVLGSLLWLVSCMIHDSALRSDFFLDIKIWILLLAKGVWAVCLQSGLKPKSGEIVPKAMAFWSGHSHRCHKCFSLSLWSSAQNNGNKNQIGQASWLKYL